MTDHTSPDTDAIHRRFGLTYANYLVLPRTLLQSMPGEWQTQFVALLDQLDDAFDHIPQAEGYKVEAATEHEVSDLTDAQMAQLGITEDWYRGETPPEGLDADDLKEWEAEHEDPEGPTYHRDGQEINGGDLVMVPAVDPVPHYNRGRTYIEPRICDRCKGSGVDPENTTSENYGDIVRELPEPCSACQLTPARES
ncbi:hypothetical protein ACGFZR_15380 [Streptomyces sp. NPDC048241]|uniref:hypothetical protein n=1 Tax=Streptomyces sp. NPDC048241 TaxID=3365521 RepID=UPI00371ABF9F